MAGGAQAPGLVLLADPAQSIYYQGIPWKAGNVYIAPARSRTLTRNYRNTRQILEAAWSLAQHGTSYEADEEPISPEVTRRPGPRPTIVLRTNGQDQDQYIIETILHLCGMQRYRPGDVAVMARKREHVNRLRGALESAGLAVVHFREDRFEIFGNEIKAITVNSAKGLEFPVVFLAYLNEGDLPRWIVEEDEETRQAELRKERRLCYVGMTRAADRLYLLCDPELRSRFADEIDKTTVRFE